MKIIKKSYSLRPLYRILCALFFAATLIPAWGEKPKMAVESFEPVETDVTSIIEGSTKFDQNGEKCALIKIQTTEHNFMFDVGSLGIVEVEEQNQAHPGEIWLYVPNGVKTISIQHPTLGSINDYDLGRSVKKGKTYLLKLTSDQVNTLVVDYNNSQILRAEIVPHNATFYLNGMIQQLDANGINELPLSFGTYTYRVTADNYHPTDGQLTINNKDEKHQLNVRLKQAFGYLTVDASNDSEGASVLVDDNPVGQIPLLNAPVKSGDHKLTVNKKLYLPYHEDFSITDSAFVKIRPLLTPNYGQASISVANDQEAQIFADGEYLGQGSWQGRLEAGKHILEARKDHHVAYSRDIDVSAGTTVNFDLQSPTPIVGTLQLTTTPPGAQVLIDNQNVGTTPFISNNLIIGNHKVEINLKGYKTENLEVNIEEGKTTAESLQLTDFCSATLSSSPSNAYLYIDGKYVGQTPYKFDLMAGQYRIDVRSYGYSPYSKTMNLDGNTNDFTVNLHRNFTRQNEFYIQAGYNAITFSGIAAGIGGYIHNFNVECNYIMGLGKSDKIYWNDKTGSVAPMATTYQPSGGNFKVGYGIRINNRIRLTPQVGAQLVTLKETLDDEYKNSNYNKALANGANAISATIGARFSVAVANCVGISLSPQYVVGVSKSEGFKALSDISSKIKGYSDGFGCNVSVNLFF